MDEQIKAFIAKLNTDVKTLWENNKIFVIVFGLLIVVIKFKDVIIDILVSNSKRVMDDAQKKSQQLQSEENSAKSEADKLLEENKKLDADKPKVGEDWNKK